VLRPATASVSIREYLAKESVSGRASIGVQTPGPLGTPVGIEVRYAAGARFPAKAPFKGAGAQCDRLQSLRFRSEQSS